MTYISPSQPKITGMLALLGVQRGDVPSVLEPLLTVLAESGELALQGPNAVVSGGEREESTGNAAQGHLTSW